MKKLNLHRLLKKISDKPHEDKILSNFINMIINTRFIRILSSLDDKMFLKVFQENPNPTLKKIMYVFSRVGDGYIWIFTALFLIVLKLPLIYLYLMRSATGTIFCIILFTYSKNLVNRTRPYKKHHKRPMIIPPDRYSFPSGHTIVSFSIAITFGTHNPLLFVYCIFFSTCIAISRVYTGVHYPFDVIISSVLGVIVGLFSNALFYFIIDMPIIGF